MHLIIISINSLDFFKFSFFFQEGLMYVFYDGVCSRMGGREIVHTKIIATVGPASRDEATLHALAEAGVRIFRLNFSHGSAEDFREIVTSLRRIEKKMPQPLTLLQDLSGPKLRIGDITTKEKQGEAASVAVGDHLLLGPPGTKHPELPVIALEAEDILAELSPGDITALNDGGLHLRVVEKTTEHIAELEVLNSGLIPPRKGISFPGKALPVKALTEKDRKDLADSKHMEIDAVALSYVQSAEDIDDLHKELEHLGIRRAVAAKIERMNAVEDLGRILRKVDAVMVARGDLGLECPLENLPGLQKRIIAECNAAAVPVITATQMLLSMVHSPTPTRAEVTDIANAVLDGTDCLMLSEETAIGRDPVAVVEIMAKTAKQAEKAHFEKFGGPLRPADENDPARYLAYAACRLASNSEAAALVAHTTGGSTVRLISSCRPLQTLYGLSPDRRVLHGMNFCRGVVPISVTETEPDHLKRLEDWIDVSSPFQSGANVVLTAGQPKHVGMHSPTNVVKIYRKSL
jgi:pyruvate kinase